MPEETPSTPADTSTPVDTGAPVESAPPEAKPKFTLEKIDADNVKKTDSRPDVTVINIPNLQKQKTEIEEMIGKFQSQLDQINEVLFEFAKLK